MGNKAYSYLRFSTPDQMKGDSRRRQYQMAVDYAAAHGLELQDVSFEDLGVSAFHGANAEMGRLGDFVAAAEGGAIESGSWLLIENLDRLSRAKPRKAVRLLERICECGITLVTLTDNRVYDQKALDDPMAFMYAFMVAIRSHDESVMKALRLRSSWRQKRSTAAPDRIMTKRVPTWLRVEGEGKERRFEVNSEQAAIVRRVFTMAAEGIGQHKIAEALNREGVPTVGGAKHWHRSLIAKWLKSPAAIGTLIPHTIERSETDKKTRHPEPPIEGYYPAIISREVFEAVAALQGGEAKARAAHDGPKGLSSLLAGMARCCNCGGTMTRVNKTSKAKGGRTYLVCAKAKAGGECEYRGVDQEVIERAIISLSEQMREKVAGTILIAEDLAAQIAEAEARVSEVKDQFENVQAAIAAHPVNAVRVAMLDNYANAKQVAEQHLVYLRRRHAAGGAALVVRSAEAAAAALEADPLDISKANAALRQAFDRAVIDWQWGNVVLHWRHTDEWVLRAPLPRKTKLRRRRSEGTEQPFPPQPSSTPKGN